MQETRQNLTLANGFSPGIPVSITISFRTISTHMLKLAHLRSKFYTHTHTALASHYGKLGLIPGKTVPRFLHLGIVPGDAADLVDKKPYEGLIKVLVEYYTLWKILVAERYAFYSRVQKNTETIAEFVLAIKNIATSCNFGTFLNEALQDKLVVGIADEWVVRPCMSKGKNKEPANKDRAMPTERKVYQVGTELNAQSGDGMEAVAEMDMGEYPSYSMYNMKINTEASRLLVDIEGQPVVMEVDTGAAVTLRVSGPKEVAEAVESLKRRHPEVFHKGIGTITGYTATLHLKPNVVSKFWKTITVPYALKPRVEQELEMLVSQGIIYPVTKSDAPAIFQSGVVTYQDDVLMTGSTLELATERLDGVHPQSNGMAERVVQDVKKRLLKCVTGQSQGSTTTTTTTSLQHKVDDYLFSYRKIPSSTTGTTPMELFLGRKPRTRLTVLQPSLNFKMQTKQMDKELESFSTCASLRQYAKGDSVWVRMMKGEKLNWVLGQVKDRLRTRCSSRAGYVSVELHSGGILWRPDGAADTHSDNSADGGVSGVSPVTSRRWTWSNAAALTQLAAGSVKHQQPLGSGEPGVCSPPLGNQLAVDEALTPMGPKGSQRVGGFKRFPSDGGLLRSLFLERATTDELCDDLEMVGMLQVFVSLEQLATHQCGVVGAGWKCPCCDVVSPTASAAQRHMDSHSGVKAFRCKICRYKGNTLRGMRTHIRMHFEKRSADIQEENFIICITGDETSSASGSSVPPVEPLPPESQSGEPSGNEPSRKENLHFCDYCTYSSSYKGNVVRHYKLVHNKVPSNLGEDCGSSSSSIEGGGATGPADESPSSKEDNNVEVIVKQESRESEREGEAVVKSEPSCVSDSEEIDVEDGPGESQSASDNIDALEATDLSGNNNKKTGPKYCKSCDISFNYLSTFIAHKKFYCSSHAGENAAGRTAETPVLTVTNKNAHFPDRGSLRPCWMTNLRDAPGYESPRVCVLGWGEGVAVLTSGQSSISAYPPVPWSYLLQGIALDQGQASTSWTALLSLVPHNNWTASGNGWEKWEIPEKQSTSSIIWHDSHMRKSGDYPARNRTLFTLDFLFVVTRTAYTTNLIRLRLITKSTSSATTDMSNTLPTLQAAGTFKRILFTWRISNPPGRPNISHDIQQHCTSTGTSRELRSFEYAPCGYFSVDYQSTRQPANTLTNIYFFLVFPLEPGRLHLASVVTFSTQLPALYQCRQRGTEEPQPLATPSPREMRKSRVIALSHSIVSAGISHSLRPAVHSCVNAHPVAALVTQTAPHL
ncbi:hypothetical protein PR048_021258 [Dryococelus australis]|uniref:Uncharacterized protein n=1 Tax=Dryococelus australis TaxID=614101 RepID=A0ABQ9GXP9_9NEOP|nr:hypothetical protein PR048_021258 [Dryococelus australis]